MARYVLLRFENDEDAHTLVEDAEEYPDNPILTPCQEHMVYATVVDTGSAD